MQHNVDGTELDVPPEIDTTGEKKHMLMLPYQDTEGHFIFNSMKRRFKNLLPQHIDPTVAFTSCKLSSQFAIKHKIEFNHKLEVMSFN